MPPEGTARSRPTVVGGHPRPAGDAGVDRVPTVLSVDVVRTGSLPVHRDGVLALQRLAGNAAVRSLVGPSRAATGTQGIPLQRAETATEPGGDTITPPVGGINKTGFIDNSDGSEIRTGPAESGGRTVRDKPLPAATKVFVSGTHPDTAGWWYVTATLGNELIRGYVQDFRVTTELPEPTAKLYEIQSGDTAELLAAREFGGAVRPGHDLRYYENVLLFVNQQQGRPGITGTAQDPDVLGGGSNNIQLVAGQRIWLVSPAYATALESVVGGGSLTAGAVAAAGRVFSHVDDIMRSITDSPRYLAEVGGEYAQAISEHLPEIIGIMAAFVAAEALSAFLAATPSGVGQIAAVVIQFGLAAFGAIGLVTAGADALVHAADWLTLAWTASGDEKKIADASREFLRMCVSIAMAALAFLGVKSNMSRALKIADNLVPPPGPAMALAGGGELTGAGSTSGVALGPPSTTGPLGTSGALMAAARRDGDVPSTPTPESVQALANDATNAMRRAERLPAGSAREEAITSAQEISRQLSQLQKEVQTARGPADLEELGQWEADMRARLRDLETRLPEAEPALAGTSIQPFSEDEAFIQLKKRRIWTDDIEGPLPNRNWSARFGEEMPSNTEHEIKIKLYVTGTRPGYQPVTIEISVIYDRLAGTFEDMHESSGRSPRQ